MKKILCSVLFSLAVLFAFVNCTIAADEPLLIHKDQNFDTHRVGEKPSAFDWHNYNYYPEIELPRIAASRDNSEVVKVEKNGNSENLAARLNSYVDPNGVYTAFVRSTFNYYPIKENGVISFSFRVEDFSADKRSHINTNVISARHVSYMENEAYFEFITVRDNDVFYNGKTLIKNDISKDTWYRVDFVFNVKTLAATLYFDGEATNVTLPQGTANVSELRFDLPKKDGSAWYIDDIRIYEASNLLTDEKVDAAWKKFTDSAFYFGYEFETGRASNYDYMAFLKCDGKSFSVIETDRIFIDNVVKKMPCSIYRYDEEIMVPVRTLAEGFGAEVEWNQENSRIIVNYNGRTMEVSPGEYIYYINGKPAKLHYPVEINNGTACMQIDVLFNFLQREYIVQRDLLWFDNPSEFDWHMPLDENGDELWGTNNTMLNENIYERIFRRILYDHPSDEEVDQSIRTFSPENMHPRLELTPETVLKIKEGITKDEQLKIIVNSEIEKARKYAEADIVTHATSDGERANYTDPIKRYFTSMAFAYQMSESEQDRALFKQGIWRQIEALNKFPDFHFQQNSALNTGTMAYGLAYAYDWVSWSDNERKIIEDMSRRNIFEWALQAYNSSVKSNSRDIGHGTGNQALITNGGIVMLAISMYETDPDFFSDIIRGALRAIEGGDSVYFPRGEYPEGISYWSYAADFLPRVLKGLQTSMGQDFAHSAVPGVLETAKFPISMRGATTAYAFGDGEPENAIVSIFMFCADQTGNKTLAEYRKQQMGVSGSTIDIINWVYDTKDYSAGLDAYEDDIYVENSSTVIMKTGWGSADTSVSLHGGANNDPHGHADSGTVQFDMNGVRFGMDLPRENYNLRDVGYYDSSKVPALWPDGYPFKAQHYYRYKGEGHNIVVANRSETNTKPSTSPDSYDVKQDGKTEFIKMEFGDTSSYAILDMTDVNDVFDCAIRGVKLDKINNVIEIQDDIRSEKETDYMWSMHTYADIEISPDGKSAILTESNCKIKATILNDCDLRFEDLPAAFDTTYGTANKPPIETPNTVYTREDAFYKEHGVACDIRKNAHKLAVRGVTAHFKLSVAFQPYLEGDSFTPEYIPFELWKNTNIERQTLSAVTVNGEQLEGFSPDNYNYTLYVLTQESESPKIEGVPKSSNVDVKVLQAETVPGVTNILLVQDEQTVGLYSFVVSPLNDTSKFHTEKQLPIFNFYATSEPQGENPAKHLFDGSFDTKYATDENGGSVTVDLGSIIEGNLKLNISCANGDARKEFFKIEYSDDGAKWTEAFNGSNSGTTKGLEQFDISQRARYVKVSFYGSSQGAWVSVTELFVSN